MPKLATLENCTGCTACMAVCPKKAINMQADEFGFKYPVVSDACIDCKLCESICPVLNDIQSEEEITKAYAAFALDEDIRMDSTSGGLFTLLAEEVLAEDGVVYGACYDENYHVRHIPVSEKNDISLLRQSKYAQSDLGNIFDDIISNLESGKKVLFSGTPCQVYGLKAAVLAKNTPHNNLTDRLILVDFVCHSVPSPKAWNEYVKYRSIVDAGGEKQVKINLRSKETGWSNYSYANLFEYSDGKKYLGLRGKDLFMKLFLGDYICRRSCEVCNFRGYERASDITLADFWGVWETHPEMDDNKGTSAILTHTRAGRELMRNINSKIKIKEVLLEDVSNSNPAVLRASSSAEDRDKILKLACEGEYAKIKKFLEKKPTIISRAKSKLKRRR